MKIAIPLSLAGITFAAAAVGASSPPADAPVDAKSRTCIPLDQVVARRTVAPNGVEFDLIGGVTYRNEFENACTSVQRLGSGATIAVTNAESGTLCTGDRVKVFDPAEIRATGLRTYPYCRLGKFTAVSAAPGAKH